VRDIYVWWIGADAADTRLLASVRSVVERTFGVLVHMWTGHDRPVDAFDARRQQHSSTRILRWLIAKRPEAAHKMLALTDVDLFIPILTFVFGEAQLNGIAAVVSTARLRTDHGASNVRLLTPRLAKECVHELGHTFGLIHCDHPGCVMTRSVNVFDVDAKTASLCDGCWARYQDLRRETPGQNEEGSTYHEQRADPDSDHRR
jgi:archaemetzincin